MNNPGDEPNPFGILNNIINNEMERTQQAREEFHDAIAILDQYDDKTIRIIMRLLFKYPQHAEKILLVLHLLASEQYRIDIQGVEKHEEEY